VGLFAPRLAIHEMIGNQLFIMKISHSSTRFLQIFHENVKMLQISNKKLYRGRLKAKNPARRLNGAVYQFFWRWTIE
jgi:hypothetical protein